MKTWKIVKLGISNFYLLSTSFFIIIILLDERNNFLESCELSFPISYVYDRDVIFPQRLFCLIESFRTNL